MANPLLSEQRRDGVRSFDFFLKDLRQNRHLGQHQEADEYEPLRDGAPAGRLPKQADREKGDARMDSKREGIRGGECQQKHRRSVLEQMSR